MNKLSVLAFAAMASGLSPAWAETAIGAATEVARNTLIEGQGVRRAISAGDAVSANNVISTDAKGRAAFRFLDDTRLSVGPNSSVKLDRFVFEGEGVSSAFVLRATKGLLRFSTGRGDHEAYRLQTPAATIGVRGTEFDVKIEGDQVRVSVSDGEVVLCPNRGRPGFADCVECRAGFSILATRTQARIVPTSSLPQIRADALLPLPVLAGLPGAVGGAVQQATGAVGDATRDAASAIGNVGGAATREVGGAVGGATGAVGGVANGVGGVVGGINGVVGGVGGTVGGIGRTLGGIRIGR